MAIAYRGATAVSRLKQKTKLDTAKPLQLDTAKPLHSPRHTTVLRSSVQIVRLPHGLLRDHRQAHPRQIPGFLTVPQLTAKLGMERSWIYDRIHNGTIQITPDAERKLYLFPDTPETLTRFRKLRGSGVRWLGGHEGLGGQGARGSGGSGFRGLGGQTDPDSPRTPPGWRFSPSGPTVADQLRNSYREAMIRESTDSLLTGIGSRVADPRRAYRSRRLRSSRSGRRRWSGPSP
jgi:hypothetical protein